MSFAQDRFMRGTRPNAPERLLTALTAGFVVVLVMTNVIGNKLFQVQLPILGTMVLTSGIITYPMTFWFTDLVSELYGKKRADYMVLLGFVYSVVVFLILGRIVVSLPLANVENAEKIQEGISYVFGQGTRIMIGSMTAYMVAQLTDNYLYHFWRRLTKGKHLWLRNNGSTLVSQLLDTIIVTSIFMFKNPFYADVPYLPGDDWKLSVVGIIVSQYLCKAIMAAIDTPFIYLGVYLLRGFARPELAVYAHEPDGEEH